MKRIVQLDALRALAIALVMLAHYRSAFGVSTRDVLAPMGRYGVVVFFVISGFIIPRVMALANYRLRGLAAFMYRRVLRLYPPYLVALALTIGLSLSAALAKHVAIQWSAGDLIGWLVYVGAPSENPVFWTLQVEMCFYLFLALLFPLLNGSSPQQRWLGFLGACLLGYFGASHLLFFNYLGFFLLGLSLEQYQRDHNLREFCLRLIPALALSWNDSAALSVAFAVTTMLIIAGGDRIPWPRPVLFLGGVSYSFYLIHFPVGVKFINAMTERRSDIPGIPLLAAAFLLSLACAYLLFKTIENPFARLAARKRVENALS